ncbi:MAG: polysaccharide deacetylase family protein [Alcanivorax sp.]|nr:polysaccharide deacetylase family protein [Alcanivorax sp.]
MPAAPSDVLRPLPALVSIHDVMPETRSRVQQILARLPLPAEVVTLLVVPGRDWQCADLEWLHALQAQGYPLAGHGWQHRCDPPTTVYHKLHSLLLSRDVAEHLSLSAAGIEQLICRCHGWFAEQGLTPSSLYVPPAWALGRIAPAQLANLPFRYFETLNGVYDARERRLIRLPLAGFEADSAWRAWVLQLFNGFNVHRARATRRPLRIGIHPYDLELKLAGTVFAMLEQVSDALAYETLGRQNTDLEKTEPRRS